MIVGTFLGLSAFDNFVLLPFGKEMEIGTRNGFSGKFKKYDRASDPVVERLIQEAREILENKRSNYCFIDVNCTLYPSGCSVHDFQAGILFHIRGFLFEVTNQSLFVKLNRLFC